MGICLSLAFSLCHLKIATGKKNTKCLCNVTIQSRESVLFSHLTSCRFALVCVGSEASSRKLMELLSKRELHGQNPIVTPCNKQSLSQFEMQSRKSKCKCFDMSVSLLNGGLHIGYTGFIHSHMYKYSCLTNYFSY